MRAGRVYRRGPESPYKKSVSSRKLFFLLLIFVLGILYAVRIRRGGQGIPCIFHLITGLKCPGCGITRMFMAVLEGDFKGALNANPFLFLTFPFPAFLLARSALSWVKNERFSQRTEGWAAVYCVGLILFGILRNLV